VLQAGVPLVVAQLVGVHVRQKVDEAVALQRAEENVELLARDAIRERAAHDGYRHEAVARGVLLVEDLADRLFELVVEQTRSLRGPGVFVSGSSVGRTERRLIS
jgi:hypothetical protein